MQLRVAADGAEVFLGSSLLRRSLNDRSLAAGQADPLLLAGPAGAATVIDAVDADRMQGGAAVQVTVAVTCDPIGPDSQAFVSMTLWQGTYPGR